MAQAKVWNDNVHPYTEVFKGEKISIAPKSWIIMERDEAEQFRSSFAPMKFGPNGEHLSEGFKMIRVEPLSGTEELEVQAKETSFVCNLCRYSASSEKDLAEHSTLNHKADMYVDEAAEKEASRKRKAG